MMQLMSQSQFLFTTHELYCCAFYVLFLKLGDL